MKTVNEKKSFTIEYTNYAKGIAIIALLIHHFVYVKFQIPYSSGSIRELIVLLTKVCVPLFAVLSGYGITKSYIKYSEKQKGNDGAFVFTHLKKLLTNYWWVYIPTILISLIFGYKGRPWELYGTGLKGLLYFLLDFTGMRAVAYTPTYCNTWWFIEVTLIFYAIFPWLYKAYKKLPVITLTLLSLPLLYRIIFGFPEVLKTSDRELFYLFPFAIGMLFADKGIADRLVELCESKKALYCVITVISAVAGAALAMLIPNIGLLIFALSIIASVIMIKSFGFCFKTIFEFLGKYSMNVFLTHSLYMGYVKEWKYFDSLGIIKYAVLFLIIFISNFAIAVVLEYIKKKIRSVIYK